MVPGTDSYTVTVGSRSGTGRTFSIVKANTGIVTRTCSAGGSGGCKTGGTW